MAQGRKAVKYGRIGIKLIVFFDGSVDKRQREHDNGGRFL